MLATITRAGRSDEYGRALLVGATYDGTINQVRALVSAGYATTTESLFDGGSGGDALSPADGMTASQVAATQALVSGARILDAVSRNITAGDNGASLAPAGTITYTIPAGLDKMPSFTVDCPASGVISVARSGAATINGAATTLTRSRAGNPVGFVVLAHQETDSYGVSGS